ncbi:T9SS type A sorting domain-containing protein [Bacteroidota bacterium]
MKTKVLLTVILLFVVILTNGQWDTDNLSGPRCQMGSAVLGSKIYFAGGADQYFYQSKVEIYDVVEEEWDEGVDLSIARSFPSCVANGAKVFFAGGYVQSTTSQCYSEVDIWNSETEQWEAVEYLSVPRYDISALSYGNKVLFAGGADPILNLPYDVVDIYDTETGQWSIESLSVERGSMGAAVVGDEALFAGGLINLSPEVTDIVDIYNFSTNTWSTHTLSEARAFLAAVTVGSKVLFAGGMRSDNMPSDRVDIYDASTGSWDTSSLSQPRSFSQTFATSVCNKAYFVGGAICNLSNMQWEDPTDVIDIYDGILDEWSVDYMPQTVINYAVGGAGNHLLIAGGLIFPSLTVISNVEIFIDNCPNVGIEKIGNSKFEIKITPNPVYSSTTIQFSLQQPESVEITILSQLGRVVDQFVRRGQKGVNKVTWDAGSLPTGVYMCRVSANCNYGTKKMVIVR